MERYNPFAADTAPTSSSSSSQPPPPPLPAESAFTIGRQQSRESRGSNASMNGEQQETSQHSKQTSLEQAIPLTSTTSRYTTSFPDPFGGDEERTPTAHRVPPVAPIRTTSQHSGRPPVVGSGGGVGGAATTAGGSNRSNSVTFLHKVGTGPGDLADDTAGGFGSPQHHRSQQHPIQRGGRQASGGFSSFLSRATSVTSSSVTDRVSSTLGSMRGAVDSLSSQFSQGSGAGGADISQVAGAAGGGGGGLIMALDNRQELGPTICRQRVVLILDAGPSQQPGGTDWASQFNAYRRLVRGLPPQSSTSLALSSFFTSSSGGGFTLGGGGGSQADPGADLIEQVNFRDLSVLANQASGTAAVQVSGGSGPLGAGNSSSASPALPTQLTSRLSLNLGGGGGGNEPQQQQPGTRIVRPEFVVVRQRGREQLEHLKGVVRALDYCLVPTFEPHEIWSTFQDRQLIFAKLLRVQRRLGKEQFPLIPQVFCQTHRDLVSYIQNNGSNISLPCLVRTGALGRGKIRIDNLQMLRDFATIMATSGQSCTIEQHLEVKRDLVVQRLGTSLKLFKRNLARKSSTGGPGETQLTGGAESSTGDLYGGSTSTSVMSQKQTASRQTSLGTGVLSSFMSTGGAGGQQQSPGSRRSSNPSQASNTTGFEKLADVNARYRQWVEAIASEFDNKLEAFCIKIVIASNDREYIVGLRNCSMDFLGSQENQDEDRRSFVELVISKMNTILPKHQPVSREVSASQFAATPPQPASGVAQQQVRRTSSDDETRAQLLANGNRSRSVSVNQTGGGGGGGGGGGEQMAAGSVGHRVIPGSYQAQPLSSATLPASVGRRSSERGPADGLVFSSSDDPQQDHEHQPSAQYSRQFSLGQSFFDQTSTALSSFQRQSMSFLKRLDTRSETGGGGGTPPLSAKPNLGFDSTSSLEIGGGPVASTSRVNNVKSASMDVNQQQVADLGARLTGPPPKPPPPPPSALANRQSSLASYSSSSLGGGGLSRAGQRRADSTAAAPATSTITKSFTNPMTPQNSLSQSSFSGSGEPMNGSPIARGPQTALPTSQRQNQRVIRQNSALSAFEPFDPSLRSESAQTTVSQVTESHPAVATAASAGEAPAATTRRVSAGTGAKYDTVSMKSGNSNTSEETTTAEDTMNNLKKTFASIFGDKCE